MVCVLKFEWKEKIVGRQPTIITKTTTISQQPEGETSILICMMSLCVCDVWLIVCVCVHCAYTIHMKKTDKRYTIWRIANWFSWLVKMSVWMWCERESSQNNWLREMKWNERDWFDVWCLIFDVYVSIDGSHLYCSPLSSHQQL